MELTESVRLKLEQLKSCFVLMDNGRIAIVDSWKSKKLIKNPIFGSKREVQILESISLKYADDLKEGTKSVYVPGMINLEIILAQLIGARSRFIKMRSDMDKFGYTFKHKGVRLQENTKS